MINKFNIAKALLNKAKQVSTDNGYLLIPESQKHEPSPGETYAQEMVLYGDDNSIGISDNSSDVQFGIYQLNINTPKSESGGKWSGLTISSVYQAGFSKGLELAFGGQSLKIKSASLSTMMQNDTHYIHILSVKYSVIN